MYFWNFTPCRHEYMEVRAKQFPSATASNRDGGRGGFSCAYMDLEQACNAKVHKIWCFVLVLKLWLQLSEIMGFYKKKKENKRWVLPQPSGNVDATATSAEYVVVMCQSRWSLMLTAGSSTLLHLWHCLILSVFLCAIKNAVALWTFYSFTPLWLCSGDTVYRDYKHTALYDQSL